MMLGPFELNIVPCRHGGWEMVFAGATHSLLAAQRYAAEREALRDAREMLRAALRAADRRTNENQ